MLNVKVYTDGSCLGNPGVGGYAAIMQAKGSERIIKGMSVDKTTNNRMELKAIVEVVNWLNKYQKEPCEIEIHTDSQYVCNCSTHPKKWLTSKDRPNQDLWIELITEGLRGKHHIKFIKVEGHSGLIMNERCDKLAKEQAIIARHQVYGG